MNAKKIVLSLMALIAIQQAAFAQEFRPKLVRQTPENLFIPQDFDNNDNAQIVIDGTFPNTCYKTAPAEYMVDATRKVITVRNRAYHYSSGWCAFVTVPYYLTVDLGILPDGKYTVRAEDQNGASKTAGFLPIYYSKNSGPDDFLYAPVSEALLLTKRTEAKERSVVIRGTLTNSCMSLATVKVLYRPGNVIEILPTAKLATGSGCTEQLIPFEKRVDIEHAPKGKALLHVRSLSGQAINSVVNFDI